MAAYENLSDSQKKALLLKEYVDSANSFATIAKKYATYPNKLRRDATKFGIHVRDKSEAQKLALSSGRHAHPTKGKERTEETKNKIGMSVLEAWENMNEQELLRRKEIASENWKKMSSHEKNNILHSANQAVRKASKSGSKLEIFLMEKLIGDGYKVDFHKEHVLSNTKLQIDLFLPMIRTAIEVDGPSHFEPVWGDDALKKNQKYDSQKNGLILGKGLVLIRIKQVKDFSKSRATKLYLQLKTTLDSIGRDFPDADNRYIIIGE